MSAIRATLAERLEGVPITAQFIVGAVVLAVVYSFITGQRPYAGIPVLHYERKGWERLLPTKFAWMFHGKDMLQKGTSEFSGPFQIRTASGYKIVLPNKFAEELKSHPNLNFPEAFKAEMFVDYPGMDGVRQGLQDGTFMQEVVRVKLTQSLGLVTDDLVEECDECMQDFFGGDSAWHTVPVKQNILDIVARLSARVFLGKELCRDKEWLQVSKDYTVDSFVAANLLRMCPDLLRPLLFWAIPSCRRCVSQVKFARSFIQPEVDRRRQKQEEAMKAGVKAPKQGDTIAWMVECAKGRKIDYVAAQLALTTAAIHTTSETTSSCIFALCENPEIIEPLRQEMIQVLSEDGWSKVSLYKLKLLDSFLKEVQRCHALSFTSLNRFIEKPITLSDGSKLPAGARLMVADNRNNDESVYEESAKFDVARFLKLRSRPGEENRHQFVATSAEHLAFGHGQHACPGRFFASNEMKIALCFLLLRYDLRYIPGEVKPTKFYFESASTVDPAMKIQMRRRREEIDVRNPLPVN